MKAILLHGVPTNSQLWQPLRAHLPEVTLYTPDLPGYGSSPPLSSPTLSNHLQWMDAKLPDPRNLHLVGQDFGGLLAAAWAARHGARSLTLTSSPAGLLWLWPRLLALPIIRYPFYQRFGGRLYLSYGCTPEVKEDFLQRFLPETTRNGLSIYMQRTAEGISARQIATLSRRLRRSGVPTHCLWGDADRFHPPIVARWTARQLSATLTWIPGGRHYAPFDRPVAYANALRVFWRRVDGKASKRRARKGGAIKGASTTA